MTSQTPKYQLVTAESGDASDMPTYTSAAMASVEAALDRVLGQANAVSTSGDATRVAKAGDEMTGPLTIRQANGFSQVNLMGVGEGGYKLERTMPGANFNIWALNAAGANAGSPVFSIAGNTSDVTIGGPSCTITGRMKATGLDAIQGQTSAGHSWLVRWDGSSEVKTIPDNIFRLIVAAIGQASTRRLKTKIGAPQAAPDVTRLQPKAYEWTDEAFKVSSPGTRYGLIAEDAAAVDERFATKDAEGTVAGLDQHALIAALIAKVTELQARIDTLEGKPS